MSGTISPHNKAGLCSFLARFFLIVLITSFPKIIRAQVVEYTQTSLVPFVTTIQQQSLFALTIVPDFDTAVEESMIFYTPVLFDGSDVIPTNIVRRNPMVDTFSEAIGVHRNSAAMLSLIPAAGTEDFVTLIGGGGGSNPSISFSATPLSTYNFPVGSSIVAPTLADALPSASFSEAFGCGSFPSADLPNFQIGVQFDSILINKFYTSGPFPTVNDNPATIMTGTINANTPDTVGPVVASPSDTHDKLVFFGATVDTLFGLTVGKIPVTQFGDLGAPTKQGDNTNCPQSPPDWPQGPLVATRPVVADLDGDDNTDLVILVNIDEDTYNSGLYPSPKPTPPQDFIARFKGDGAGGLTNIGDVPLGNNIAVFDLAVGDFNGDGVDDLFITTPVPGSSFSNAPFVQIITDPLGAFNEMVRPTLPSGVTPVFVDGGDCDGDGKADDVFLTGIQLEVDPSGNPTKFNSTDVICLIDGQSMGPVVFPASKMNMSLPASAGQVATIPFTTGVGKIGCDTGWTGINLLGVVGTKSTVFIPQILIAERLDCNAFFKFISGEGQACFGISGSGGCAALMPSPKASSTKRSGGLVLLGSTALLAMLPLLVIFGPRWLKRRVRAG